MNIQIQGPWLPSPDQGVYSGMEDAHYTEYNCASKITAQLFIPAWKSACTLFRYGQMDQLRYEQTCFADMLCMAIVVSEDCITVLPAGAGLPSTGHAACPCCCDIA